MSLPIASPFLPMEAKINCRNSDRPRVGIRAEMGRFPLYRLPRMGAAWNCSPRPGNRSRVIFRRWRRRSRKVKASQICSGRRADRHHVKGGCRLTICCNAFIQPPAASRSCRVRIPPNWWCSICWWTTRALPCSRSLSVNAAGAWRRFMPPIWRITIVWFYPVPRADPAIAKDWLKQMRGQLDGIVAKRSGAALHAGRANYAKGQRRCVRPIAWWAGFATTSKKRLWDRCCSVSTTTLVS